MQKKFNIILADPPWLYNARNNSNTKFGSGMHIYEGMKPSEICNLPVSEIADENCVLFLWVTFPRLQEGLDVMKAWGFEYKTCAFTWVKTNKNNDKPFFGIGYYTKSNAELCLLGIKGKMKPVSNSVSQVIISPREEHSKKPAIARDKIIELFGDLPRIELFARQTEDGWNSLGNEIDGLNIQDALKRLTNTF